MQVHQTFDILAKRAGYPHSSKYVPILSRLHIKIPTFGYQHSHSGGSHCRRHLSRLRATIDITHRARSRTSTFQPPLSSHMTQTQHSGLCCGPAAIFRCHAAQIMMSSWEPRYRTFQRIPRNSLVLTNSAFVGRSGVFRLRSCAGSAGCVTPRFRALCAASPRLTHTRHRRHICHI